MPDIDDFLELIQKTSDKYASIVQPITEITQSLNISAIPEIQETQKHLLNNINLVSEPWSKSLDAINNITNTLKPISENPISELAHFPKFSFISTAFEMQKQYKNLLNHMNIPQMVLKAWPKFDNADTLESILELTTSLKSTTDTPPVLEIQKMNLPKLSNAMQIALDNLDKTNTVQASKLVEEITVQYIKNSKLENTTREEIRKVIEDNDKKTLTKKQSDVKPTVNEIREWVSLMIAFLGLLISQPTVINNTTNNYYILETAKTNNIFTDYSLYKTCKDRTIIRIKPDDSSKKVGCISFGEIVHVIERDKEWVKIEWEHGEGELCSGWIPDYTVVKLQTNKIQNIL